MFALLTAFSAVGPRRPPPHHHSSLRAALAVAYYWQWRPPAHTTLRALPRLTSPAASACSQVNYSTRFALPQIIQEIANDIGLSPPQKATLLALEASFL